MQAWIEAQQATHEKAMRPQARYFRLTSDVYITGRWYLEGPLDEQGQDIIPWQFMQGKVLRWEKPLVLSLYRQGGRALDFTETGLNIAVGSGRLVSIFERLGIQDEVQFIPARVEEHSEPYFVLNTLRIIKCVDEARCEEFSFFGPEHGEPERVGHYRHVSGLKVDPDKIGDASIFRPWGWEVPLIVSKRVKLAIEEEGLLGPKFLEV